MSPWYKGSFCGKIHTNAHSSLALLLYSPLVMFLLFLPYAYMHASMYYSFTNMIIIVILDGTYDVSQLL